MSVASSHGVDEAWVLPLPLTVIFTFMDATRKRGRDQVRINDTEICHLLSEVITPFTAA